LAEGDPSLIVGLVNDTTPLYDTIVETERFVVHVLDASARRVAEVFAGLFPSPGGIFSGVKFHDGHYGPLLDDFPNRALCRLQRIDEAGFQRIVRGVVDEFEVAVAEDPLVYFRGRFRTLSGGD
jgi:flavin reductase (DIM6/NTAB) family NADH-FMN oxidoreductase RutF